MGFHASDGMQEVLVAADQLVVSKVWGLPIGTRNCQPQLLMLLAELNHQMECFRICLGELSRCWSGSSAICSHSAICATCCFCVWQFLMIQPQMESFWNLVCFDLYSLYHLQALKLYYQKLLRLPALVPMRFVDLHGSLSGPVAAAPK